MNDNAGQSCTKHGVSVQLLRSFTKGTRRAGGLRPDQRQGALDRPVFTGYRVMRIRAAPHGIATAIARAPESGRTRRKVIHISWISKLRKVIRESILTASKQQKMEKVINWRSKTIYVDTDTGEQLSDNNAKHNYIIIKKHKHVKITKSTGHIEWTIECRRSAQTKFNFG